MAKTAILVQRTVMRIVFLMTGKTIRGGALEHVIDMTGCALHSSMRTCQFEGRQIVVKTGPGPGLGGMTGSTILAKLTIVMVIFLMAGKTIGGSTFKYVAGVTGSAQYVRMRTCQLEGGQVVVKRGPGPGLGGMTGRAILAKLAIMMVIFLVTTKTIGRDTSKNVIDVTGLTGNAGVRTI